LKDTCLFVNEKTIQQRIDKYEMAANPMQAFLNAAILQESLEADYTTKDSAFRAYKHFCISHKLPSVSKNKLGNFLETKYEEYKPRVEGMDKRPRCWKGMKLNEYYSEYLVKNPIQRSVEEWV
jgi:hypothetical protein